MKAITHDGVEVDEGDTVWVFGSLGDIHKVSVLPAVTTYELFGPIPVAQSFSTKEAALAVKNKNG